MKLSCVDSAPALGVRWFTMLLCVVLAHPIWAQPDTSSMFEANNPDMLLTQVLGPTDIVVTDINNDGHADIISVAGRQTGNPTSGFALHLWDRHQGAYVGAFFRPTESRPSDLTEASLNGDRIPDVIATAQDGNQLSVLLGSRGGVPKEQHFVPSQKGPHRIAARDIDQDGDTEVVCLSRPDLLTSALTLYDVTPLAAPYLIEIASEVQSAVWQDVSFGDLDGDGLAFDLLVLASGSEGPSLIHHNLATDVRIELPLNEAGIGTAVLTGDLDHDSSDEVIVTLLNSSLDPVPGTAVVMRNSEAGLVKSSTIEVGAMPAGAMLAYLNDDGILDLLTANAGAGVAGAGGRVEPDGVTDTVTIAISRGDASFFTPFNLEVGDIVPSAVGAGDVNGNGRVDLVVARSSEDILHVFYNQFPSRAELPLDLVRDGTVDPFDLFRFAAQWRTDGQTGGDLDGSGVLDKGDLSLWSDLWQSQKSLTFE